MKPSDLVIIVPMLGRQWTIKPLLDVIDATTPGAHVLFMCTAGDRDVIDTLERLDADHAVLRTRSRGDYARKINLGIRRTTEPLILTGACDIEPQPGWFENATALLSDTVQVVGTNDAGNPRTAKGHSTHTLMTRTYAELPTITREPGPLCEKYAHEYVDDELVGTARYRGVYAHCPQAVIKHLHPMWGGAAWDDSYRAQRARMAESRSLYISRRQLWT